MSESGMMRIGAVAERTELSFRTLRHYDEVGLVTPSGRTDGGFRLYTDHDVERLLLIRRMKPLGYSLDEMGELLSVVDALAASPHDASLQHRMREIRDGAESRREKLEQHLAMADEFLALLEDRRPHQSVRPDESE
ncbi:MerR family transcriptional regulator [Leucobacter tardus]|nr:MerR family transcriptional regulator [Leucobacter tardus]